jgi:hypothetical protein
MMSVAAWVDLHRAHCGAVDVGGDGEIEVGLWASDHTAFGLADAKWISRMSPWCMVASCPLSQAIVTASQLVAVTVPLSAALPRQDTRSPFLSFLDSSAVTLRLH